MDVRDLNHVALSVADLDASVRFYGDTLGLRALPRPDFSFAGAWFALGDRSELHLIVGDGDIGSGGRRGSHFALTVDGLAGVAEMLTAKGVVHDVLTRPDGVGQIFIQDPDGHWIEFTSLPG